MLPSLSSFRLSFVILAATCSLHAHDPGLSTLRVEVRSSDVSMTMSLAMADASFLLAPAPSRPDRSSDSEGIATPVGNLFQLTWDGVPLDQPIDGKTRVYDGDNVEFTFSFKHPPGTRLVIKPRFLNTLPPGHRQYATVVTADGVLLAEKLLNARDADIGVDVPKIVTGPFATNPIAGGPVQEPVSPPSHPAESPFHAFLLLGIEHILTGYDHLLFLLGLLIVCTRKKSILLIISSFTIGHSITLILATLDWATIPSRLIEPAIAASIVFVGVENLVTRGKEPRRRWALTFFFGLIHGFGFAGVLRQLGVGQMSTGLLVPLFSFNVGVEIGQLGVAAVTLPILAWARTIPAFARRGIPVMSAVVVLAGLYWLLERTVFA